MVFRASFSISIFFAVQALASKFGSKTRAKRCETYTAITIEFFIYTGLLIGCFFIPAGVKCECFTAMDNWISLLLLVLQ